MVRPQRYFAWRVARQLFIANLFVVGAILLVIGFSLRLYVYQTFLNTVDPTAALGRFDAHLTNLLMLMFGLAALALLVPALRYARPLGRLIQRARELRRLDTDIEQAIEEEERSEDPGEWYDLERALNRIHKDLRRQTAALSREREELSALIGAVSDAIFAIDDGENPLFFNSQFAFLFRPAALGEKPLRLGETFRVPEVLEGYRAVLKDGQMRIVTATLHTLRHGLPRHFSISIAPLRVRAGAGPENTIEGAVGVFHDVTELKASEQIRIEFVANASHELRTPLTSIKGYVDTLRDDLKAQRLEEAPKFLEIVSKNVDRLIFLVNDLLDLSALESGADLVRAPISTAEITESVLRQLEPKRAVKKQTIEAQLEVDTVLADAQRLEQVLVNLVHNAIKYTPDSSRIIVAWERATEPGAEGVVLRIKDNGPGISLEHQSRLFERFYRVDAGRSRDQGGTGLGLSIVKHIMIKHGGSVRVQSRQGSGAEFVCFFPGGVS